MYAIVKTGGKQYRVEVGVTVVVEKLEGAADAKVELTEVLLVSSESGEMTVGRPTVTGARVLATIVEHGKGPKISAITFKPKKGIRLRYGHRQQLTRLRIDSIVA